MTMVTATGAPLTGKPVEVALDMSTPAQTATPPAGGLHNKAYPADPQEAAQAPGFGINGKTHSSARNGSAPN